MPLIARKLNGTAQDRIRTIVAEHLEMLEPGLSVLETSLRLGRTTIDVVAVDAKQTLVLVAVGEVADEKLLVSTLDAYIWCVAFPDNVRRLYPAASITATRPPRVIIVAERMPDAFLELVERLSVVSVECQELSAQAIPEQSRGALEGRGPAARATEPQPSQPAPTASQTAAPAPVATPPEPARVIAGFNSTIARQWESFLADQKGEAPLGEPELESAPEPVRLSRIAAALPSEPVANGHATNGHGIHGHAAPSSGAKGDAVLEPAGKSQPARTYVFAQLAREAEQVAEHAAVDLGVRWSPAPVPVPPIPVPVEAPPVPGPVAPAPVPFEVQAAPAPAPVEAPPAPAPTPARPAPPTPAKSEERRPVNHPALESLRFPKNGVSRQWQEFLDQLAAEQ